MKKRRKPKAGKKAISAMKNKVWQKFCSLPALRKFEMVYELGDAYDDFFEQIGDIDDISILKELFEEMK